MIPTIDPGSTLALDARSLDALRLQAKQNPALAAKGAAQQFEAVFLQTLLKSMRDATPQDGMMDSDQTRLYTSMLDQQLAQTLSAKGIGLADLMLRQLTHNQAAAAVAAVPPQAAGASAAAASDSGLAPASDPGLAPAGAPVSVAAPVPPPTTGATSSVGAPNSDNFLARMKQDAIAASKATGIPARFMLGHAALESGWGKHEIHAADGSQSFNLFGIKAGGNWKGPTVNVMTTEYVHGAPHRMLQKFRAYGSYTEAFQDYASLMRSSPRYAAVLKQTNSAGFAQGLQRAGYATDPQYAAKLTQILNGPRMRQTMMA